ncbi:MAG: acyl-CoA dehydrogenase family protein [Hyphomicrobiaceae bacterium]
MDAPVRSPIVSSVDDETFAAFRDTVRRYVRERLVPLEAKVEADDDVPGEIVSELKEMGLFGFTIPVEYGGLGLSSSQEVELAKEFGWTSPAFRGVFGTTIGIGSQGIVIDGTEAQKHEFLPRLAKGELVSSFCLTEPGSGSDAASLRTTAILDGDHYVVNGTKRYITNARRADVLTLMARTDPGNKGAAGISAFIVDAKAPGITFGPKDKKMGQRGTVTSDVIFENVRVPADRIIGGRPGVGFKTAMKVLDRGRIHIAAVCVGTAKRLIDEAQRYASEREQFGQPIAGFQLVQAMLADSWTECYAAECMVRDTAARYDAGESTLIQAAACKMYASEMVGRVADRAVQIFGGAGYMAASPVERIYRDVRLVRIYEGTTQIQQLVIAREMRKGMA